jgi:integrase
MLNDAMTVEAGRLLDYNPAAHVKLKKSRGNADVQPPEPEQLFHLLAIATDLTPPSFADLLAMGCVTALRPGELDALEKAHVRFETDRINIKQQYNAKTRTITLPKYGRHEAGLTAPARAVLERAKAYWTDEIPWVFPTLAGTHWTPNARAAHWNKVRAAAGLAPKQTFYVVTRHYFAWFSYVVLKLDKRVVAAQLGHKDGGDLIERVYGHPDHQKRLDELVDAYGAIDFGGVPPSRSGVAARRPALYVVGERPDDDPEPALAA